jgi:hypothetical protein
MRYRHTTIAYSFALAGASAPRRYYVTVYTARYPLGAAHGRLAPTAD